MASFKHFNKESIVVAGSRREVEGELGESLGEPEFVYDTETGKFHIVYVSDGWGRYKVTTRLHSIIYVEKFKKRDAYIVRWVGAERKEKMPASIGDNIKDSVISYEERAACASLVIKPQSKKERERELREKKIKYEKIRKRALYELRNNYNGEKTVNGVLESNQREWLVYLYDNDPDDRTLEEIFEEDILYYSKMTIRFGGAEPPKREPEKNVFDGLIF